MYPSSSNIHQLNNILLSTNSLSYSFCSILLDLGSNPGKNERRRKEEEALARLFRGHAKRRGKEEGEDSKEPAKK